MKQGKTCGMAHRTLWTAGGMVGTQLHCLLASNAMALVAVSLTYE